MTNSPAEKPTVLSEKMAHLRRRRVGGGKQTRQRFVFLYCFFQPFKNNDVIVTRAVMASL